EGAFASCQSLESITIPVGLNHAISTSHTTALFEGATLSQFYGCSALTSVTIKVPSINAGFTAWIDNDLLKTNAVTKIILAEGVTDVGDQSFRNKSSLQSVVFPVSASRIGNLAFQNCAGLTEVTISKGTTSIAGNAFEGCPKLNAIEVAGENKTYSSKDGLLFDKKGTTLIKCPEGKSGACVLPEGVTSISVSAFRRCVGLTEVILPEGVTGIGSHAFSECTGLTRITIVDSVTSIGGHAFSSCPGLTAITIPKGVTTIGTFAFADCQALKSVSIGEQVTTIGNSAFSDCRNLTSVEVLGRGIRAATDVFKNSPATIYYRPGAQGWGPVWNDRFVKPISEKP
ncbi:MAG: leucine-rich repeat domain-containing protein, partial [Opitutales bacterium]